MNDYENIPDELKQLPIFCLWKYEERTKGGKTKIPYNALTDTKASVNNPNTFCDYTRAIKKLNKYDGLGIRLAYDILGIDIDKCIENGKIKDFAKEIIDHFPNSYIEYSPSKTGLHILCKYKGDYDKEKYYLKRNNIEVYASNVTNRFFTITGDVFNSGSVDTEDIGINWLLETHMKRKTPLKKLEEVSNHESYLSDASVIYKASNSKTGNKFKDLFNGNTTDYSSQSEADLALCSILAFYCNGNAEQINRIFRKSKLYRNKWDEVHGTDTYGNMTITRAINGTTNFYKPISKTTAIEDFSDELSRLRKLEVIELIWSDIGCGKLFAEFYKDTLRFIPERNRKMAVTKF